MICHCGHEHFLAETGLRSVLPETIDSIQTLITRPIFHFCNCAHRRVCLAISDQQSFPPDSMPSAMPTPVLPSDFLWGFATARSVHTSNLSSSPANRARVDSVIKSKAVPQMMAGDRLFGTRFARSLGRLQMEAQETLRATHIIGQQRILSCYKSAGPKPTDFLSHGEHLSGM
jgi:hypothetical protein